MSSDLEFRYLNGVHIRNADTNGFFETLQALSPVEITVGKAIGIFHDMLQNGIRPTIALLDDKIVGTATLIIEPKFIRGGKSVARIEDVAVHPEYRKKGIGRKLVAFLIDRARKSDVRKIVLESRDTAISFWTHCGFKTAEQGMRLDLA